MLFNDTTTFSKINLLSFLDLQTHPSITFNTVLSFLPEVTDMYSSQQEISEVYFFLTTIKLPSKCGTFSEI